MKYELTGLTCEKCVQRVASALEPFAGRVEVTLTPPEATLHDQTGSLADLQKALAGTSYSISEMGSAPTPPPRSWLATYQPLLLIVGYIFAASLLSQIGFGGVKAVTASETMRLFMAGFFLVFSFFKMLGLAAFADAYAGYDLLAAKWRPWGFVYPFVEVALGVAYLVNWNPTVTNWVTLVVMGFSALGVIQAVASRTKIRCACLGTVFQLPMSTVTIVEDLGMVLMAAIMLLH